MKRLFPILVFSFFTLALFGQKISIQGTLKDATGLSIPDGDKDLTFKLYTVAQGGIATWEETASVKVAGGIYSHLLGSETALDASDFGNVLFLGVTVDGLELSPRMELTYAPYTLAAAGISNNGGSVSFDGTGTVSLNPSTASSTILANGNLTADGNVVAKGTLTADGNVVTKGTLTADGNVVAKGTLTADGNLIANSNLTAKGTLTADGNLTANSNLMAKGTLMVDGNLITNSKVGIGINAPIAPLHVVGEGATYVTSGAGASFNSLAYNRSLTNLNPFNLDISGDAVAYFDGNVLTNGSFIAGLGVSVFSDARIKDIKGISNTMEDLALLNQIDITDYSFKDKVKNGNRQEKKVVAQELKKIYPQAVNYAEHVIPNVYEKTEQYDFEEGILTITTKKVHDFTQGDKIDLHTPEKRYVKVEVMTVEDAHTFTIKTEAAPSEVFVYGKWVNDFHVVDYDAISMLNVSATQELSRQIQALQKENAALKAANAALENTVNSRLAKLEAQLAGKPSVNSAAVTTGQE